MAEHDELFAALQRLDLIAEGNRPPLIELSGGISSEIYQLKLPDRSICIKRALPTLKSDPDWHVPVERSAAEFQWMELANRLVPGSAPQVLGFDEKAKLLAMEFLDPALYPNWKAQLRDGVIEPSIAHQAATKLAKIHNATAGDLAIAEQFANDEIFYAIRLEAYFIATGEKLPQIRDEMRELVERTMADKSALVHGDISPKNIMVGPDGPVFIDAECAWYGEPAFDVAFCLTMFLTKSIWRPQWFGRYLECFDQFASSYLDQDKWLTESELETRIARLLVAMVLARVSGRSQVEYIVDENTKHRIRDLMVPLVLTDPVGLDDLVSLWRRGFSHG